MYINRELSWLEFNARVLDQARRAELPLLERIKFLAITASNLDEFFQVRVGGLRLLRRSGKYTPDAAGFSPSDQLELIRARANAQVQAQYRLFNEELLPLMRVAGISPLSIGSLAESRVATLRRYFEDNVAPLLTPLALEVEQPPVLPSLSIIIALELAGPGEETSRLVVVPLPDALPRRMHFAALDEGYVPAEDLICAFISDLFPGEELRAATPFRVTRNSDIAVPEEGADFAREMEAVLVARKFSDCVRLELPTSTPPALADRIARAVGAGAEDTYRVPGLLRLTDLGDMAREPGHDLLKEEAWPSYPPADVDPSQSMFDNMAQGDILILNPYESYEPIIRLLEEAAADPDVLVIKQVLYRTAHGSRFIKALCRAAEAGKQVTVLVELKARFDEGHNLVQAERLQKAGVQVVYGVKGFKTHAKITLIVRREHGFLRRYCHFGTGNYNEKTAALYSDVNLLTCNENLGADASQFFNSVTGLTRLMRFRRIFPAPSGMKEKLLSLIRAETHRALLGERAEITAKMNSLNDPDMMQALEKAAEAGVYLRLNVRGICCWAPGTPAARARTRIISIVDRYLEHARIFSFLNGGSPLVHIASADWMPRNLERRVELLIPIEDHTAARRLLDVLDACFRDNTRAYVMQEDGSYIPVRNNAKPFSLQAHLQQLARLKAHDQERAGRLLLEPHVPIP